MKILEATKTYGEMIKIGHTLFGLPFVLSAVCIALSCDYNLSFFLFILIIISFTSARSFAMGFNRIVDRNFDSKNYRTKNRELVTNKISIANACTFISISAIIFILSAYFINTLCFILSFPALLLLAFYSYTKRFTSLSHFVLGLSISLAPLGAWIAMTNSFSLGILSLSFALLFHISGFDLIYSLQDSDFDKNNNLFSIPARYGNGFAKLLSFICFIVVVILLLKCGKIYNLGFVFYICCGLISIIYIAEHVILMKFGLKKIDIVFFYLNVCVSCLILVGTASNLLA